MTAEYAGRSTEEFRYAPLSIRVRRNAESDPLEPPEGAPGERLWVEIVLLNTGTVTWRRRGDTPTRLGTWNPADHYGVFHTGGWVTKNRAAVVVESEVHAGDPGSFIFPIALPVEPGQYVEEFNLVADSWSWAPPADLRLQVRVVEADRSRTAGAPARIEPLAAGTFLSTPTSPGDASVELFFFDGEQARPIDELTLFALGGSELSLHRIARDRLASLSIGPPLSRTFEDGTLIKGSDDPIYVVADGRKRWIPDMETLAAYSKRQPYRIISDAALAQVPDGAPVPSVTAHRLRSPLFGRLRWLPPTVGFAADLATVGATVGGIAKLLGLW